MAIEKDDLVNECSPEYLRMRTNCKIEIRQKETGAGNKSNESGKQISGHSVYKNLPRKTAKRPT